MKKSRTGKPAIDQLNIDWKPVPPWPSHERFPYNDSFTKHQVRSLLFPDLLNSPHPRLITGFTSLGVLLEFLDACYYSPVVKNIRIVLGHEPSPLAHMQPLAVLKQLSTEIKDYWLAQGISLLQCRHVLTAIKLLEEGRVAVRISSDTRYPVHAKIYEGSNAISIGSSNFSQMGLSYQTEGNTRFTRTGEPERYTETCQLVEAIWGRSSGYTNELYDLLRALLRVVDWREAVARSCHEILEGEWARRYLQHYLLADDQPLWPFQEQGIAQALWIIDQVGSVLIADATGSGKTRMGAALLRAVSHRQWRHGPVERKHEQIAVACPPSVLPNWQQEMAVYGLPAHYISQGKMSQKSGMKRHHHLTQELIRRASILAVDEAHNYLNRTSSRTQAFFRHAAEHIILFTATPINKSTHDLMMMIQLLGADNFSDEVLKILQRLWSRHKPHQNTSLSVDDRTQLQQAVGSFILRRTKRQLNHLIDQAPDRYHNRLGSPCRYPQHIASGYLCPVTPDDLRIVTEIQYLSHQLRGISYLPRKLQISQAQQRIFSDETVYFQSLIKCITGLAAYSVMEPLRSSRVALVERIHGTDRARDWFSIQHHVKHAESQGVISKLQVSNLPSNRLRIQLPSWLEDADEYHAICQREIALYEQMSDLARKMSPARECEKAELLASLLKNHERIIAFDGHRISLYDIQQRLDNLGTCHTIVATGENHSGREQVEEQFALESKATKHIALCSDAMSEGINLQGASALVHLDMPSVIRTAEQRIGRIDRIDSEHREITIYWPNEPSIFALRKDEHFYERLRIVANVLGSNIEHPPEQDDQRVSYEEMHAQVETAINNGESEWESIQDTFSPLRALISGDTAIIDPAMYLGLQGVTAKVLSTVSIVASDQPWAFFTIGRSDDHLPFWIYIDPDQEKPLVDHGQICDLLRRRLQKNPPSYPLDDHVVDLLGQFLLQLQRAAIQLLPLRKQRALEEMRIVLAKYEMAARAQQDLQRIEIVQRLLLALQPESSEVVFDYSEIADRWLSLIHPVWYDELAKQYTRPLRLRDLRHRLCGEGRIETEALQRTFPEPLPMVSALSERIVAAVVGVPSIDPTS